MPEGDSLARIEAMLAPIMDGATLLGADLRVPALATLDLAGRAVDRVHAYGKHLFMDLPSTASVTAVVLHSHLAMEGRWVLAPDGARLPGPADRIRAILSFPGVRVVGLELGTLEAITPATTSALLARLGPDPLHAWDAEEALCRLRQEPDRPLGLALLDQSIVAGIGNIYRCESLYASRADPFLPVAAHDDVVLARVLDTAATQLRQNVTRSPRRTAPPLSRDRYLVYGRAGRICPRGHAGVCLARWGDPALQRGRVGGDRADLSAVERDIFFCARCQGVLPEHLSAVGARLVRPGPMQPGTAQHGSGQPGRRRR